MRRLALRMALAALVAVLALSLLFPPAWPSHSALGATGDSSSSAIPHASNSFGLDLYARLRIQPRNLFLSPFSIETAMSMVSYGARGQTASQMAAVLHLSSNPEEARSGFAVLLSALQSGASTQGYRLDIANGLWSQKEYPFQQPYLDAMRSSYNAEIDSMDFIHNAEAVRNQINSWVARRTQEKIKDLFPPSAFRPATRLILANAIYFKGAWARPFQPTHTHDASFTAAGGAKVQVHMMQQQGSFKYLDAASFQVLELPYKGDTLAMDIFLPREADGLAGFEQDLTAESLSGSLGKLHPAMVRVGLPRFTMTSSFELTHELGDLGMPLAFSRGADFSGISERGRELLLSTVVHKAYVDVNEQGTEAAAATGVGVTGAAMIHYTDFIVDHPCFFLIRDLSSGAILFLGRLDNPS